LDSSLPLQQPLLQLPPVNIASDLRTLLAQGARSSSARVIYLPAQLQRSKTRPTTALPLQGLSVHKVPASRAPFPGIPIQAARHFPRLLGYSGYRHCTCPSFAGRCPSHSPPTSNPTVGNNDKRYRYRYRHGQVLESTLPGFSTSPQVLRTSLRTQKRWNNTGPPPPSPAGASDTDHCRAIRLKSTCNSAISHPQLDLTCLDLQHHLSHAPTLNLFTTLLARHFYLILRAAVSSRSKHCAPNRLKVSDRAESLDESAVAGQR
jgi:hypothetical protein